MLDNDTGTGTLNLALIWLTDVSAFAVTWFIAVTKASSVEDDVLRDMNMSCDAVSDSAVVLVALRLSRGTKVLTTIEMLSVTPAGCMTKLGFMRRPLVMSMPVKPPTWLVLAHRSRGTLTDMSANLQGFDYDDEIGLVEAG